MRNRQFALYLLYLLLLLSVAPGCQALHVYRPVKVLVRDAETKQPLPAAEVYLSYPLTKDSNAPCNSSGITTAEGIAQLRAAPSGKYGAQVQAIAPGHIAENLEVGLDAIEKIKPAGFFEKTELRSVNFTVEMYAEPRFTVELVVPISYRGLVKTEMQIQEDAAITPGQRCFRYEVSATGTVVVKGSSLLQRVSATEYHARYVGGPLLGDEMDDVKVGFRWLKGDGKEQYFVVGTQKDYDTLRRRLVPEEAKTQSHSSEGGGKGGGHGGRHHRGGGQSSE